MEGEVEEDGWFPVELTTASPLVMCAASYIAVHSGRTCPQWPASSGWGQTLSLRTWWTGPLSSCLPSRSEHSYHANSLEGFDVMCVCSCVYHFPPPPSPLRPSLHVLVQPTQMGQVCRYSFMFTCLTPPPLSYPSVSSTLYASPTFPV